MQRAVVSSCRQALQIHQLAAPASQSLKSFRQSSSTSSTSTTTSSLSSSRQLSSSSRTRFPPSSSSSSTVPTSPSQIIRPLVPPPDVRSGPLLERRPDRALPDITSSSRTWLKTLPIFIALITVSSLAIFNYQKSSSSTVNSILYALRTNPAVREMLGDEIYFASKVPWIRGPLNPLQGNIDISFYIQGSKGIPALTKFVSKRKRRDGYFETVEWSLTLPGGEVVHLLEMEGTSDPMGEVVRE